MWRLLVAFAALTLLCAGCAKVEGLDDGGGDAEDFWPGEEDDPPPPDEGGENPLPEEDGGMKPPEEMPWPEDGGEPPPPEPPPPEDGGPPEPPPPPEPADAGPSPFDDGGLPPPIDAGSGPPPPPPTPACDTSVGLLSWSCDGPVSGQTCVNVNEPSDPNGWADNHVCSIIDLGLRWSTSGPIDGMRCTAITEPSDPNGWGDNYLCLPPESVLQMRWSNAGPVAGYACLPWYEPRDPHAWGDNYLCLRSEDPGNPTPVPPAPARYEAVFSNRGASSARDLAIENRVIALIDAAIPRSRVRIAVYTFTRATVADALVRAHRRGVDVRVVVDGDAARASSSQVPRLVAGLGSARVTRCAGPGSACLGTGIMHHKTFLFSALSDGSRSVVVQSSHNFTAGQLHRHNNAVIIRGDSRLFAAFERTFQDQRRDAVRSDYYRVADGYFRTRAYFYPRASGDTVVSVLDNVECGGGGRIRVAMAFFTDARLAVARALARRARAGCDVDAVIGDEGIPVGRQVLAALRAGGVTVTLFRARRGWALHSKYLLVDARYAGSSARRRLVFTGSHNWTGAALVRNDETLLRVEDDGLFASYVADWSSVRESAARP